MEDPQNLTIIHYPDPRLRERSRPVDRIDNAIHALADRMKELVVEANGIGLAAPQLGVPLRLFVSRHNPDLDGTTTYINPKLTDGHGQEVMEEGCLSIPEVRGDVSRSKSITISYTNLDGEKCSLIGEDLLARVWQHEFDHLNGVLILDRMGSVDKIRNRRLIKDLEETFRARAARSGRSAGGR